MGEGENERDEGLRVNGGGGMKGKAKEWSGDVWVVFLDK